MPHTSHELNIFEPRYRKLYNDILVSGSRRFVVTSVHPEDGRFAEVGVVFYLTDLSDVSEETSGQVKYVCQHDVIGRVRIKRVLNPARWEDAATYLRVETTPLEDDDTGENLEAEEAAVMDLLGKVAELQQELGIVQSSHFCQASQRLACRAGTASGAASPFWAKYYEELDVAQISPDFARHVNASRAEPGGLWGLAALWAEYYEFLVTERQALLEEDLNRVYWSHAMEEEARELNWLEQDEDEDDELDDFEDDDDDDDEDDHEDERFQTVYMDDLPPAVQSRMQQLRDQFQEEVDTLMGAQTNLVQLVLQSASHHERLVLLRQAFSAERRRLATKIAVLEAVRESTESVAESAKGEVS